MARGVALSTMVAKLRSETGRSETAIASADEDAKLKRALARIQEFYYDDFDWSHLNIIRTITLVDNTRFYATPTEMKMENIKDIWHKDGTEYRPMDRGIGFDEYQQYDTLQAVAATGTVTVTAGTGNPGTNKVTAINVNSVDVLVTDVDWTTSHAATAALIATQINATTSVPNYTATSSGAVVTIRAAISVGDAANTFTVSTTVAGDVTTTDVAVSGGIDAEKSNLQQRWDIKQDDEATIGATTSTTGDERLEIWPVPDTADDLYVEGKRNLTDLLVDADTCDLDDQLIIMTAAAEMLARENKKDGAAKAAAAKLRYHQMKRRSRQATPAFKIRGEMEHLPRERLRAKWS